MEFITIGTIRTCWGLKGWLKIASTSGQWSHFNRLDSVLLRNVNSRQESSYHVEGFRMHHGGGLMKLTGIDTPESGKLLAGREIRVPREQAAPLEENEWYLADLVGLLLVDPNGETLGTVSGIVESADDLLEISRPDGRRFLVPFRSEFVSAPEDGRMKLLVPWLLDTT